MEITNRNTSPGLARALEDHARNCDLMQDLLATHDSPNVRALHWTDLPIHDLVNLYSAPAPGNGIDRSGATV